MKARGGYLAQLLRPVLDTYSDSAVALVGCRSLGIERECCEHDVVVVSKEVRPRNTLKVGDARLDLFFLSEKEALQPSDPEIAVSMAFAKTVRDNSLLLSAGCSAAQAVLQENCRRSAQARLGASLKAMGRADGALSSGSAGDADFWLLAAAYEFAFAWLYAAEVKPAPSHLLAQLKQHAPGSSKKFEAFSAAAGLEQASRKECEARLEAISVLYDMLDAPQADPEATTLTSTRVTFQIVKEKAAFLNSAIQHADCYSFLGYVAAEILPEVLRKGSVPEGKEAEQSLIVSQLSKGEGKTLSDGVIAGLGLGRQERDIQSGLSALREQVSSLTRTA